MESGADINNNDQGVHPGNLESFARCFTDIQEIMSPDFGFHLQ
jgi:hypothetical protein